MHYQWKSQCIHKKKEMCVQVSALIIGIAHNYVYIAACIVDNLI